MKHLAFSFLLISAFSFQSRALQSTCYPNTPEAKSWPVCVIYLHGLHPSNDRGSYTRFERENRPLLSRFSDEYLTSHKCRLAAPVAPLRASRRGIFRDWQHRSLSYIEASAKQACGGKSVQLKKGRTLLGFSAGGWEAYHLAAGNCKALRNYNEVVGIGLPELRAPLRHHKVAGTCSKLSIYRTHDFPTQFSQAVQRAISASLPDDPSYTHYAAAASATATN